MTEGNSDAIPEIMNGLSPTVPVCFVEDTVDVVLAIANNNQTIIVGFQFRLSETVVASWRLDVKFMLGKGHVKDLVTKCHQLSGHVSNDNTQVNILMGKGTCSVGFPMSCCMISKQNLGQALEWIQRKTLRITIKFVSAVSNDIGPLLYRHRFSSAIKAASDSVAVVVD